MSAACLEREVVRDEQHVARGHRDQLGEGAGRREPDERVRGAGREPAGPALLAGVAGHQRHERGTAAHEARRRRPRPTRSIDARRLVAQDHRVLRCPRT